MSLSKSTQMMAFLSLIIYFCYHLLSSSSVVAYAACHMFTKIEILLHDVVNFVL